VDAIHVQPEQKDVKGQIIPVCFDTVLVNGKGLNGIQGQGNKGEFG
jgi:hypothetical protein